MNKIFKKIRLHILRTKLKEILTPGYISIELVCANLIFLHQHFFGKGPKNKVVLIYTKTSIGGHFDLMVEVTKNIYHINVRKLSYRSIVCSCSTPNLYMEIPKSSIARIKVGNCVKSQKLTSRVDTKLISFHAKSSISPRGQNGGRKLNTLTNCVG